MERPSIGPVLPAELEAMRSDGALGRELGAALSRAAGLPAGRGVLVNGRDGMRPDPRFFALWDAAARREGPCYATLGGAPGGRAGRGLGPDALVGMCATLTGPMGQNGVCREACGEGEAWDRSRGATMTHGGARERVRRARAGAGAGPL